MSTFVNLDSVCGKQSASVDIFDLDANPNGAIFMRAKKNLNMCVSNRLKYHY